MKMVSGVLGARDVLSDLSCERDGEEACEVSSEVWCKM